MLRALKKASQFMDEPTEYRILRLVRDSNTISRTEIARLCNISKPTVSEIVNRYLEGGFLERVGESDSTKRGGRRREMLRFNSHAGFVIGIDIRRTESIIAVTDLNANILASDSVSYPVRSSSVAVLKHVAKTVDRLVAARREFIERCVGIGAGLPGVIDHHTGVVKLADTLRGWNGVDIRLFFRKKYGVPVYVENDVKARTLAEFLFGAGRGKRDQVFLWIGDGIGVGIIIDGKLHRGITESAGEIGYNELRFGAAGRNFFPVLYNGQRDYGDILSNAEIVKRYATKLENGRAKDFTIEGIVHAAERGEKLANQLIDEVGLLVSILCINLINTLNPQLLVIAGRLTETGTTLIERVRRKVHDDLLSVPVEAVTIVASQIKKTHGVTLGAVGLVLYDLFKPASNVRRNELQEH